MEPEQLDELIQRFDELHADNQQLVKLINSLTRSIILLDRTIAQLSSTVASRA